MTNSKNIPPLALTMGDPAGIGGEIALQAWRRRGDGVPAFVLLDDPARLAALAERTGLDAAIEPVSTPGEAAQLFATALPVLPVKLDAPVSPGRPDIKAAGAVIRSIDLAMALAMDGRAAAMVTNPIHKSTLYAAGFAHPGHTEYLAELAGLGERPVMMLACPELRVVPVTIHLSLAEAVRALNADDIVHAGLLTARSLTRDFAIDAPRLAVAALNPHAGEDGQMGTEEIDIIAPAVARLKQSGIHVEGPAPADTLFHDAARARYDAVLCMYHDQALIPLKTLDFAGGVNMTLGLPFVRTSPDHGTAFDIAGSGKADPSSLIAALGLAADVARNRRATHSGRDVA
ncbi:MAG: 4-hydroxythreonine-4-phosphate dehydrogenase PdxA [Alphaproteobacteria bacterium]